MSNTHARERYLEDIFVMFFRITSNWEKNLMMNNENWQIAPCQHENGEWWKSLGDITLLFEEGSKVTFRESDACDA